MVDNDITPQIALNSLLMWNGASCLEARAYMFVYFDLSVCFRHYTTSQHIISDFPSLINLWIIPNLQVLL